jgi:hypothetical protein
MHTPVGKRQPRPQHQGQPLQHQRIAGRPEVTFIACGQGDARQYPEAKLLSAQFGLQLSFYLWPPAAEIPHIGSRRPLFTLLTEPGKSSLQEIIVRQSGEADAHSVRAQTRGVRRNSTIMKYRDPLALPSAA